MISVDEAALRIASAFAPLESETIPIGKACGRVLAADPIAALDQPPSPVSSMDGYAVRANDVTAPATLRVIGAAPAGHPFAGQIGNGEAVRIFTGGVVPNGADAIVIHSSLVSAGRPYAVYSLACRYPIAHPSFNVCIF